LIFTRKELEELENRLNGKKVNYKIWYRAKPKVKELLFKWFDLKSELQKLL